MQCPLLANLFNIRIKPSTKMLILYNEKKKKIFFVLEV